MGVAVPGRGRRGLSSTVPLSVSVPGPRTSQPLGLPPAGPRLPAFPPGVAECCVPRGPAHPGLLLRCPPRWSPDFSKAPAPTSLAVTSPHIPAWPALRRSLGLPLVGSPASASSHLFREPLLTTPLPAQPDLRVWDIRGSPGAAGTHLCRRVPSCRPHPSASLQRDRALPGQREALAGIRGVAWSPGLGGRPCEGHRAPVPPDSEVPRRC